MRMRKSADEYYRALGLQPGASAKEMRRAYLRLVKQWHPDRFANDIRRQYIAQEKLKEINEAYSFLRDYRPGQPQSGYSGDYSYPPRYSHGATADWQAYQRRANYEPPIADPYEGDYQYRPVGNSRSSRFAWIFAAVLAVNLAVFETGLGSYSNSKPGLDAQFSLEKAKAQPMASDNSSDQGVAQQLPYFFVGSSKADVYRVQGMPSWADDQEWRYGESLVHFRGPVVERWESRASSPLKAITLPAVDPQARIKVGSTTAEVLAIQGTPGSLKDAYWAYRDDNVVKITYWHYGASTIQFSQGKVIGWDEKPGSPLKVGR